MPHLVSVYRDAESPMDCTNGGVSSIYNRLMVYLPGEELPEHPMACPRTPVCVLTTSVPSHPVVRPHPALLKNGDQTWTMFGGNFGSTSDSRFLDAVNKLVGFRARAISIHDRVE
jgi:hypothetical protein